MTIGCMQIQAGHKRAEGSDYKGVYIFRFNAENLIRPYDNNLSWVPEFTGREFTAASISPTMQIALPARTTGIVGGTLQPSRHVESSMTAIWLYLAYGMFKTLSGFAKLVSKAILSMLFEGSKLFCLLVSLMSLSPVNLA